MSELDSMIDDYYGDADLKAESERTGGILSEEFLKVRRQMVFTHVKRHLATEVVVAGNKGGKPVTFSQARSMVEAMGDPAQPVAPVIPPKAGEIMAVALAAGLFGGNIATFLQQALANLPQELQSIASIINSLMTIAAAFKAFGL